MIINLLEWDLTYTEFVNWVAENDIVVDAINGYGGGASTKYKFRDEEDFIIFKLIFVKTKTNSDIGFFYCPYIPFIE
jgi:hypothetical protein